MADPQRPVKEIGLALNGQRINTDDIPAAAPSLPNPASVSVVSEFEDYEPPTDIDYSDLSAINTEISKLRMRLHRIRKELKQSERAALKAKYTYEAAKKRTWISITGGSDKSREAMAELLCEKEYSVYLVTAAISKEITQHSRDIRTDLDALKELSNNLRRQIDL